MQGLHLIIIMCCTNICFSAISTSWLLIHSSTVFLSCHNYVAAAVTNKLRFCADCYIMEDIDNGNVRIPQIQANLSNE